MDKHDQEDVTFCAEMLLVAFCIIAIAWAGTIFFDLVSS